MKKFLLFAILLTSLTEMFPQQEVYISKVYGLYVKNVNSCGFTYVGPTLSGTSPRALVDIALTPDGTLWGVFQNRIYRVNKQTGALTFTCNIPVWTNALVALDNSNLLYDASGHIYKLNLDTYQVTDLGFVGYDNLSPGDMAFFDNKLYVTGGNKLMRFNFNNTMTAVTTIDYIYNAPDFPILYGLMGATLNYHDKNVLLGFTYYDVYEICPIDGSYQLICQGDHNSLDQIYGAAATILPTQNPLPTTCATLANDDFETFGVLPQITPNPVNKDASFQIRLDVGDDSLPYTLRIVNLQGATVFSKSDVYYQGNPIEVGLAGLNLTAGLYVVELQSSASKHGFKLVIR